MAHLIFIIAVVIFFIGTYRVGDCIEHPYNYSTFQFFISFTMVLFPMFCIVGYIDYMFIQ